MQTKASDKITSERLEAMVANLGTRFRKEDEAAAKRLRTDIEAEVAAGRAKMTPALEEILQDVDALRYSDFNGDDDDDEPPLVLLMNNLRAAGVNLDANIMGGKYDS